MRLIYREEELDQKDKENGGRKKKILIRDGWIEIEKKCSRKVTK